MSLSSPAVPSKAVLRLLLSLVKSPMPPPRTLEAVVKHCRSEGLIVRAPRRHGVECGYRLMAIGSRRKVAPFSHATARIRRRAASVRFARSIWRSARARSSAMTVSRA